MLYDKADPLVGRLRRTLLRVLPGDSDLEAFCLDHFPSVHQRFSLGMERQAKLNLLLQYVSAEKLVAALNRYASAEFTQEHEALNRDKAPTQVLWHLPQWGISIRPVVYLLGIIALIGLGLGFAWALGFPKTTPIRQAILPPMAPIVLGGQSALSTSKPAEPLQLSPSLKSENRGVFPPVSAKPIRTKKKGLAHVPEDYIPPPIEW